MLGKGWFLWFKHVGVERSQRFSIELLEDTLEMLAPHVLLGRQSSVQHSFWQEITLQFISTAT